MIKKDAIIVILFFYFLFIPLLGLSQTKLEQRKENFNINLENLRLKPEELSLGTNINGISRDSLLVYYEEILTTYKDRQDVLNKEQNIFCLYEIGLLQTKLGYNELAIETFGNAIKQTDKIENIEAYVQLNLNLGDTYRHIGMLQKSNDIILDILDLQIIQKDSNRLIGNLGIVAENYENLKEYQLAMETCLLLYDYHFKKNDFSRASYILIQLGRIGSFLEVDTSYFEYFHLANRMAMRSGDESRIENNLVNTGNAYRKAGYPAIALKYLKKANEYSEFNSPYGGVYTLMGLTATYLNLDSVQQAYKYAKRAMKKAYEIDAYIYIYHSNIRLATCHIRMHQFDSAKICLTEAVRLNKILNNKNNSVYLFKQLYELSLKMEDYPVAIQYLDSSYSEYTKFVSEKNDDKLAQLRVESDYYIHRNRIIELVSNNKIEKEKSKKLIAIIFGVLIVLILTFYFTAIIRKRLKQLRESYVSLVKKNIELDEVNNKLHACEIAPKKKIKLENIKHEDMIINKLINLLNKKEVYTNPDLSLKSLADNLGTNTSYLSAAVNSHFSCNLPGLINQHRIDKARKMLVSDEYKHYSMEGIASEVGFKSRSVFYQSFKTITGLSPILYIENYKLVVSE